MNLLLTGAFKYSNEQIERLESLGYDIIFVQDERETLQIDVSNIDAVVCNGLFLYNDISRFKELKFIQLTSAGLDRVPLDYIKEKGISLYNAKGVYSVPMAEWIVLKILEIYKKSRQFHNAQRERKWEKHRDLLELTGKTVCIIGYGAVGQEAAKRLKPFGVKVIGVGRRKRVRKSPEIDEYFLIEDLNRVLRKSDVVVLTVPLTEETTHLIGSKSIEFMKDNSVLVNVSRGGVIDETALINSLEKGKFLGVALDVFEEEPLSEKSALWNFDRVIITPHNSFVSDRSNERLFNLMEYNLSTFVNEVQRLAL